MTYLDYFKELCSIPHGSGNTKMISDWLVDFAVKHNLEHYQDDVNNVIMIKEASAGMEDAEPIIIQGHMDMVAVHDPDYEIDMTREGLRLVEDGDFLSAEGTTLGGDDGIAVAYGLALMEDTTHKFPRIELVITVDEEVGMDGAEAIDTSVLKGHTMLNIDSEEEGTFLVSCAGGARVDLHFPLSETSCEEGTAYKISISNLLGGHSGAEIHKGHANAIVVMANILKKFADARMFVAISDIKGGNADNVIASTCEATVLCKNIEPELFELFKFEVLEEYLSVENKAVVTLTELGSAGDYKWYQNSEYNLVRFLNALPNGVIAMSRDIEGLVETSLNQGVISMNEEGIDLSISVRSSIEDRKQELVNTLHDIATEYNVGFGTRGNYPGWAYRQDSVLREKMVSVYENMFGTKPEIMAIHAGLECGLFSSKIPGLDCVSFGPNLYDIHSTSERMSLSSAERMWNFLVSVLEA